MLKVELVRHEARFEKDIRTLDVFTVGEYEVRRLTVKDGEFGYTNYSIFTGREFYPEITYNDFNVPEFRIQTCAYGALTPDDIEKVVAGYQEAIEVVKTLEQKFLKGGQA